MRALLAFALLSSAGIVDAATTTRREVVPSATGVRIHVTKSWALRSGATVELLRRYKENGALIGWQRTTISKDGTRKVWHGNLMGYRTDGRSGHLGDVEVTRSSSHEVDGTTTSIAFKHGSQTTLSSGYERYANDTTYDPAPARARLRKIAAKNPL